RYDKFCLCKRQYYFDYYGKFDRENSRQKINELKKLTSVPLEIGNIVHDTLQALLNRLVKTEIPLDREKFFEFAVSMAQKYCATKTFAEVYYKEADQIDMAFINEKVHISLKNFLKSDRFSWIIKEGVKKKKYWIIEPPGYGETRIDGLKAYCKVDFLFPVDERIYILDWKTGKADDRKHKKQLVGYTAWASYHFDKKPDQIFPVVVYLNPTYKETQLSISPDDLSQFTLHVKKETEEMYSYLVDTEKNIPKGKENFPKTADTFFCKYCNYREICP
ncbi:MAG: PD-(D/E)XK nuclease family protein, partial [Nitrospinota bacterium]